MALNFPSNPVIGQSYTYNEAKWVWDGASWSSSPSLSNFTGTISSPDAIQLSLNSTETPAEGKLWYNPENDTLNLGMSGGVVQQVGQEFFLPPCRNNSGVAINTGDFVMATGVSGDKITVAKAVTNGTVAPEYMVGVATQSISIDSEVGMICTNGIVRDINTSGWVVGTLLYPNPSIAGGLTSTKPSAPNIKTPIAIVLRQHASTGRILVRMSNGSVLGGTDSNVEFGTLANGDVVTWVSSSGRWENKQPSIIYPSSGIVVSTGTDWGTSKASPTGDIVGTTDTQVLSNKTFQDVTFSFDVKEKITVSATAATGTIPINVLDNQILYYTTNASDNFILNIRGNTSTTLNTLMSVGESITVTFLNTNGATAYYNTAVQVDGASVTPNWQGGTAPTSGNSSSIDSYSYTIIKTAAATFKVLAAQTQFK